MYCWGNMSCSYWPKLNPVFMGLGPTQTRLVWDSKSSSKPKISNYKTKHYMMTRDFVYKIRRDNSNNHNSTIKGLDPSLETKQIHIFRIHRAKYHILYLFGDLRKQL